MSMNKSEYLELFDNLLTTASQQLNSEDYEELLYRVQENCDLRLGGDGLSIADEEERETALNLGEENDEMETTTSED